MQIFLLIIGIIFFIFLIKIIKEKSSTTKLSSIENKKKGALYEEYIADIYKKDGYDVIENGKEKGLKDDGIDIIAKKDKEVLFIQCKDWNIKNKYRINHKEIQYMRMNVRDYLQKNKNLNNLEWSIVYITSDNILTKSAIFKIKEHQSEISHKVIKNK